MPNNPVQVVLNVRNYFNEPPPGHMGPAKDFFEGRDKEFAKHREKLTRQVEGVGAAMQRSGISSGIVKVSLRREAFAKSHRPQRVLFPPESRPCVGVSGLGELFFHVTAEDVVAIGREIASAETETRIKRSQKSGKDYVSPSEQRSDAGAVEAISLPDSTDKRGFSLEDGLRWLSDAKTSGAYFVEFFGLPSGSLNFSSIAYFNGLREQVVGRILDSGLYVEVFQVDIKRDRGRPSGVIGFRLTVSEKDRAFNLSIREHEQLIKILESHPYIRKISLPPLVSSSGAAATTPGGPTLSLPLKNITAIYPKIGVVDGGIANFLSSWTRASTQIRT
jgi:hypothetical protein